MKELTYIVKVNNIGTFWYLNEKLHRENGPACEYIDGSKFWYLNGQLHRENKPACEWVNGNKYWYLNGQLHREDGPACEYIDGSKYWYLNGKLHREDGPAIEHIDGHKSSWYLNGVEFNEKKFKKQQDKFKNAKQNGRYEMQKYIIDEFKKFKDEAIRLNLNDKWSLTSIISFINGMNANTILEKK